MPFIPEHRAPHIFRRASGHLEESTENRSLLIETASDSRNLAGHDQYGNLWYTRFLDEETQIWVQVRGEEICNGGINRPPRPWSPSTGFAQTERSQKVDDEGA